MPRESSKKEYADQKRGLDEMHNMLGEELYAAKVQQLKDEFLKSSAM
jgi:hypothetical protein